MAQHARSARSRRARGARVATALAVAAAVLAGASPAPAAAAGTTTVTTEAALRRAWSARAPGTIVLGADVVLRDCRAREPRRSSPVAVTLDGRGHGIRQTCFEQRVLRQDDTGCVTLRGVTLSRGGTDGSGAALRSRGEIRIIDSTIAQNRSEEPGGGVFSSRRVTVVRSSITGNLANDDGGGLYALHGGVHVVDSTVSSNLVDGSGGAIASTGDIVVEGSHVDGNTTDGDGGAIYADERADVTVVDSTVDGSTADGPGGAIFTEDGDVTVVRSTLNGNRADDRGGAIAGESDVTIVDSTVARNAAVAHVAGGIWARGELTVINTTITDNYAEGEGGGVLGARSVVLDHATILGNVAPMAADVGAGDRLIAFGSVVGPASQTVAGGQVGPAATVCRAPRTVSQGYNAAADASCGLRGPTDVTSPAEPMLGALSRDGGFGETLMPLRSGALVDRIPAAACRRFHAARPPLPPSDPIAPTPRVAWRADLDGRGAPRPQGPRCDIGAVELPGRGG